MLKTQNKDGSTTYKYTKCPACGSKKRHFEEQSEKAIKMDVAPVGFITAFHHDVRAVADAPTFERKPIGTEFPKIMAATDICKGCGCIYSPLVIAGKDKKTIEMDAGNGGGKKLWTPGDPIK